VDARLSLSSTIRETIWCEGNIDGNADRWKDFFTKG